jgi:hypothetical protein
MCVCVCVGVRRVSLRCKTKLLGYRVCMCVSDSVACAYRSGDVGAAVRAGLPGQLREARTKGRRERRSSRRRCATG